jgi:transcriptional regulator with XRE-family HTH domain
MSVTHDTEGGKTVRRTISQHEQIRRQFGYSVTGLATGINFSHAYVSRVEGGTLKPSARYREAVSEFLGVPQELIFEQVTTATAPLDNPKEVSSNRARRLN